MSIPLQDSSIGPQLLAHAQVVGLQLEAIGAEPASLHNTIAYSAVPTFFGRTTWKGSIVLALRLKKKSVAPLLSSP